MQSYQENILVKGLFHYTTDSLHEKTYFEDGLIARITTFENLHIATTIKFILQPGERISLGEKKVVTIKVLNYDFIKDQVENRTKLAIMFSHNCILGDFFPE